MRALLSIAIVVVCPMAFAADIVPLADTEITGGAMCVIVNGQGKVLIEDRIKINGALVGLKKGSVTAKSKVWTGNDVQVAFTIPGGKMLETADGGFTVGTGPMGKLVVTYKGIAAELKAREKCFGED